MMRFGPAGPTEGHLKAKTLIITTAIVMSMSVGGCSQIKKLVGGKPSGQVVATVNGEEITASELRAEMRGFSATDPKVMKAAQQAALQQIIVRNLLAQKAKADKLDKTADYAMELRRGEQGLLAQTYQRKLAATAPLVTRDQAAAYVSAHPQNFANRSIIVVDQVIVGPNKIAPDRFKPLKTLEEVKALFNAEGVSYQENATTIDSLSANPQMVDQISKLPAGEVFVVPQRNALIFNRVSQVRSAPFQGPMAESYAMNLLRNQKAQETVRQQTLAMYKAAEPSVVYNAAYKPAPAAKPAAAAAATSATPPAK